MRPRIGTAVLVAMACLVWGCLGITEGLSGDLIELSRVGVATETAESEFASELPAWESTCTSTSAVEAVFPGVRQAASVPEPSVIVPAALIGIAGWLADRRRRRTVR